ncbi:MULTISPECIES: LysR substrate-binding domain-containing protein [Brucella/Ochrobactrum group]|uniref:Glycine cleavage system transcriptional activator n=1 Tax=Ochrobactrum soli TaxID=2448455 RepID=A0A2P9HFZ7_9HYPH|nr:MULTISPECIES: LysR substrate-binding domain-containing protein [Brucella]MCI1002156.1 LysR family transcriptional regulator [Ochrobactrum sp. C6C9]RRD22740.1 LysR family transcriptional regulator [Brucellaceae bacterium VT-16-1752]MDX4076507.1 LysR substrate-binding domain-containing protein [Brucella sp. NBRC 113783]NNU59802.1 LysR family transcriptional regulator [[Ochrobactrum] soli]RLL71640.1 LysR family transcriptional regulator [[Ochrobactrum] soli]
MVSSLPPLSAIRVFESASRHASFTKAAEELGMTQAAVSYQIKMLEERVGAPLFLRMPRQVKLTELGERLAPSITEAFETMRTAFATLREDAEGVLTISSVATFAANWLVQRLGSFQMEHPLLAVRLDTNDQLIDFTQSEVDLAIRTGTGHWPGLVSHELIKAQFTPMLSPKLAASIGGVREPADLLRLPAIDASDPWWRLWFEAAGVPDPQLRGNTQNRLGAQHLEGRAATAGLGMGILTPAFHTAEVAAGLLIQPFDLLCDDGRSYWLVYPESRRNVPKIRAFRAWIMGELGK